MSLFRVLISGGWGYGNLGDDAILLSSLNLVKKKWPDAKIIVSSYNPEETAKLLQPSDIEVIPSMHRILFGDTAYHFLGTYGHSFDPYILPKLATRVYKRLAQILERPIDYKAYYESSKKSQAYINYITILADCDCFLMCGGGYFNNWNESFISRIEEIKVAYQENVPSCIFGQTLDNFTSERCAIIKDWLPKLRSITLRDKNSSLVLEQLGIDSDIIPDMVLAINRESNITKNRLVFIPAELPPTAQKIIYNDIINLAKCGYHITITLSRLYNADVHHAKICYKYIKAHCKNVDLVIPQNIEELESAINGCEIIVSRNLHGLILGYINGATKLISLHDGWKFKSFMDQIGLPNNILDPFEIKPEELFKMVYECNECDNQMRKLLQQQVVNAFMNI